MGDEFARLMDGLEPRGPIVGHFPLGRLRDIARSPSDVPRRADELHSRQAARRNVLRESALKRWPVGHYAELARQLLKHDCEIVLLGNSEDAWVRAEFAGVPATDLIGSTTIPEMLRVLADCDLVVSHDTGPMHLARIAGAPIIALFGPTMPAQFIVPDESTTVLWGGEHSRVARATTDANSPTAPTINASRASAWTLCSGRRGRCCAAKPQPLLLNKRSELPAKPFFAESLGV